MSRSFRNRFTIFDAMDAAGRFSSNPANAESFDQTSGDSLYSGPVAYPKMFYHPEAEERILVPAQPLVNPTTGEPVLDRKGNEILRGEQREIIWQLVVNEAEEKELRSAGWHDHPARALAAAGKAAPMISPQQTIEEMKKKMAAMQVEIDRAQQPAIGAVVKKKDSALAALAE